jgi:hypothetical protein
MDSSDFMIVWVFVLIFLWQPNGLRYPRVGGRRERHFDGTNFQPHNLLENAATPTRRVHAVLARSLFGQHSTSI